MSVDVGGRAMAKGAVGKQEHFVSCMAGSDQASNQAHSDITSAQPTTLFSRLMPHQKATKAGCELGLHPGILHSACLCQVPAAMLSICGCHWLGSCCLLLEEARQQGDCGQQERTASIPRIAVHHSTPS